MPELWLPAEDRHAVWEPVGDQLRVIGWRPGPAGLSTVELTEGLSVAVDHASPTTLAEVAIDLADRRIDDTHLPFLHRMLGEEATETLRHLPGVTTAATRPVRLRGGSRGRDRDIRWFDSGVGDGLTTFARLTLSSDIADDADRTDAARAIAAIEAGAQAAELDLVGLARTLARQGLSLLEEGAPRVDRKLAFRLAGLVPRLLPAVTPQDETAIRRVIDRLTATSTAAEAAPAAARRAPAPAEREMLVAAMAAPALEESAADSLERTVALIVDGEHHAWAGLTPGNNVLVTAGEDAVGTWARVFRRSDGVLLGLSPVRTARGGRRPAATVVVPPTPSDDLVVDLVPDPATPRRHANHDHLRAAVAAGRRAARLSRLGDPRADGAWRETAAHWHQLGDVQRANLAERHGRRDDRRTGQGGAGRIPPPELLSDELP